MYAREIEGQEFTFGVSGKLIRNVLVMYDRQTTSYWSQLLGEAVAGPLVGAKLEFLPSWQTTWAQWQAEHPDTLALQKPFRGGRDRYDGYYRRADAGVIGETIRDDRLYTKEFVIGVEVGETAVAYPFSILNGEPIVNDSAGGRALLIVFDRDSAAGVVYDRVVDGKTLTFTAGEATLEVIDVETETTWDAFRGVGVSGPLAGSTLTQIKSTQSFWFGWKDFHPDTLLYGID